MATIVWIDDDIEVIHSLTLPLELKGHTIKRFGTIREALDAFDDVVSADVILLDIFLPTGPGVGDFGDYSGLDLLRRFQERGVDVRKVIGLTVVTNESVLDELAKMNIGAILRKPVLPSKLEERVEQILRGDNQVPPVDATDQGTT